MASSSTIALFLAFNLVLCTFVTSQIPPIPFSPPILNSPGQLCAIIPAYQSLTSDDDGHRNIGCCNFLDTLDSGSQLNGVLCEIIQYVKTTFGEGTVTNATAAAATLGQFCRLTTTNLTCT
ncbi:hypothetical protein CCACVL1_04576 [Corchorus capsularis]|uniref:Hydrophobic seed protein domain-containing protein n=1 Tax=Corchorus capsularis TaxID=210143 RepID=A0A1R3JRP5_COCAP|nr:hypothetical protein CCACVL1_04576 [Corchorus capsularis]